jgi:hypothetical protein
VAADRREAGHAGDDDALHERARLPRSVFFPRKREPTA